MNQKRFYQEYLTRNTPVKVKDGCKNWEIFESWKQTDTLIKDIKETQAKNFVGDASPKSEGELENNLKMLEHIKEHGMFLNFSNGMPLMDDLFLNKNTNLAKRYEKPQFMSNTLELGDIYLSYQNENQNGPSNGFASQNPSELYRCVVLGSYAGPHPFMKDANGTEPHMIPGANLLRLASPVFKKNLYSGVREELQPNLSPVDLFHPSMEANIETFPLLLEAQILELPLEPGQCAYIPAWWWMQSRSLGAENTLYIDFHFLPHSEMYQLINMGIEQEFILADENSADHMKN